MILHLPEIQLLLDSKAVGIHDQELGTPHFVTPSLLDPGVADDEPLLGPLDLLQHQVQALLETESAKESDNTYRLAHQPVRGQVPGEHELLELPLLENGRLLLDILVVRLEEQLKGTVA